MHDELGQLAVVFADVAQPDGVEHASDLGGGGLVFIFFAFKPVDLKFKCKKEKHVSNCFLYFVYIERSNTVSLIRRRSDVASCAIHVPKPVITVICLAQYLAPPSCKIG